MSKLLATQIIIGILVSAMGAYLFAINPNPINMFVVTIGLVLSIGTVVMIVKFQRYG